MNHEPAKPIIPGCKVLVVQGPDTGFVGIAITRKKGWGVDFRHPGMRTPHQIWGWVTAPKPPGDNAEGFDERILMRIDDDDPMEEECHTQQLNVVSSQ